MTVEDDRPMINKTVQADHVAVRSMATRCAEAVHLVRRFRDGNPDLKLINHLNVGCILDCLKLLIETPLCFPRFMFQTLQTTSIKLVVSPQPRVAGEAITTTIGSQLAVKVEGIVQVTSSPRYFGRRSDRVTRYRTGCHSRSRTRQREKNKITKQRNNNNNPPGGSYRSVTEPE
ncbi:hypothetical protein DAPPUDRAFT_115213 [Daphnia pulex]|uniref:Integrator complex subunit 7 C-terminal domain-containing protein n=1 Tax=Daphnia pulex TaxID=6669 RepID=E9HKL4_DAPPU|nr:hypothetical protein DAPPUDRAFT_115213 [Daphnia pulex]|eukprot:EFX67716.1 hypothetical protein DAPPUDRAFT_115213 [Daphnia pulex]